MVKLETLILIDNEVCTIKHWCPKEKTILLWPDNRLRPFCIPDYFILDLDTRKSLKITLLTEEYLCAM